MADRTERAAPPVGGGGTGRATIPIDPEATETGALVIQLPDAKRAAAGARITPLTANETAALVARLEPMPDLSAQNAAAPALRAPSLPPARPGAVPPIAFAVPSGKPVGDAPIKPILAAAPLAAPQIAPQGEVRADAEVRIRFDQPMVPIASVGAPAKPPATITPAVAGTWRWIDTRVVAFTTTGERFPQATEFVVTVPAGTRALDGATLGAEVRPVRSVRHDAGAVGARRAPRRRPGHQGRDRVRGEPGGGAAGAPGAQRRDGAGAAHRSRRAPARRRARGGGR